MSSPDPYQAFFVANPQPMWVYDLDTLRFLEVNDAALTKYGYTRDEFLALDLTDIRPEEDAEPVRAAARAPRGDSKTSGPWRHRLRDGHEIEVEITSQLLTFADRPAALVAVRDISVERALEERFRHDALHDPRTGLGNHRKLQLELEAVLQSETVRLGPRAVLMVGIEGLQPVNVELGRDAGDALLMSVADVLARAHGDPTQAYRVGEQTFALLMTGDLSSARDHAHALLEALGRPFLVGGSEAFVSPRIGIAVAESNWAADEVIRSADAALQSTSDSSRSRVAVFNADGDAVSRVLRSQGFSLESELRRAVGADQLTVLYQPILDLRGGRISGVEALVRWNHPLRGVIAPNEFIPHAERAGVVADIDAWVLATACRQMRAWREAGVPSLRVAVNLSGRDLDTGPALARHIRLELKRNQLEPSLLEVELTESTSFHNLEEVQTLLQDLRTLGVGIALDDFGTGYSMLDRIRDLPVDRIKIDRTFVRRAANGGTPLINAVITMAHSLRLGVVAEGVETEEQLDMLRAHDCDFAQGYLIGRPVPAADIPAQIAHVVRVPARPGHSAVPRRSQRL
jgi:PAS domain S-box-containing protein/diguanylate cyclase (GGDEF)-like protein